MREPVVRRPLFLFAVCFFAACAVLTADKETAALRTGLIACLLLVCILAIPPLRRRRIFHILSLSVASAALLVYGRYTLQVQPLTALAESTVSIQATITELPAPDAKLYRARVVQSDALPAGTALYISFTDPSLSPALYDTVQGTVRLYLPAAGRRNGQSDGVFLYAYGSADMTASAGQIPWYAALRSTLLAHIHAALPGDTGNLVAGICLGERSTLSTAVQRDFRAAGLSHILVVSGLHMSILSGAVMMLLRRTSLPRGVQALLVFGMLWVFMLLVGFSPSVIRAGVLLHFVILAELQRSRADTLTSLSAAAVGILLISPYAANDAGFLLSFAATLGIVLLTPPVQRLAFCCRHPRLGALLQLCWTPLAALALTAPVTIGYFGTLSVLAPLSNLLTTWAVSFLLPLAAMALLLLLLPFGSSIVHGVWFFCGLLAKWILLVAKAIASLSFSSLHIRHTVIFVLILTLPPAAYAAWRLQKRRGLRRVLAAAAVILLACSTFLTVLSRRAVSMHVAATNTALVAVWENAGHQAALLSGENRAAYREAAYAFAAYGIRTLDFLIITDGGFETTAYLSALLEEFPAETVIFTASDGDWTAGIRIARREPVTDNAVFTFWKNGKISVSDGWWRIDIGDTRCVFAPAEALPPPAEWRRTHLLVMHGAVPAQIGDFTVQQAVLVCEQEDIAHLSAALPWGAYPIRLTANGGAAAFLTTGDGDLTAADDYWLK